MQDDEAELLAELGRIKAERAEEVARQAAEAAAVQHAQVISFTSPCPLPIPSDPELDHIPSRICFGQYTSIIGAVAISSAIGMHVCTRLMAGCNGGNMFICCGHIPSCGTQ